MLYLVKQWLIHGMLNVLKYLFSFNFFKANWCYCLSTSVKNQWTNNLFTFDEVSTSLCNVRCPGDDNYYCGKSENHMERTIYLSVYKYRSLTPGIVIDSMAQCYCRITFDLIIFVWLFDLLGTHWFTSIM
jgi:hypothetical protein